ncbi:hypothetical protein ACKWTF_015867 [Chironomus riparius]
MYRVKFLIILTIFKYGNPQTVPNVCFCVTAGSCAALGSGGPVVPTLPPNSGNIDIRIQTSGTGPSGGTGTTQLLTSVAGSGLTPVINSPATCQAGLERCCPSTGYQCGYRFPPIAGARAPIAGSGQSNYMSYPWQAVLLASDNSFQGSGVLIDHLHVLTAAHKLNESTVFGRLLKVRLGEWDASSLNQVITPQEYQVARIFIHPQFTASNLRNSIAILRLSTPVTLGTTPSITPGCLPTSLVNGVRCFVSGWGRQDFTPNSQYSPIQKEVDLPIIDQNTCQNQLRATRLGSGFALDFQSFMCAGGEAGKDACIGDGGSPLSCQIGANWFAVGLVAWGIGCGTTGVPGVYINVANYISWIQQTTRS